MASDKKTGVLLDSGEESNEDILSRFQDLSEEARSNARRASEMELDLNEHKIVIDTLTNVDPKRKCYRMIGGILCECVVEDVIPSLINTKEQLASVITSLRAPEKKL